ncbi:VTC domain-containing protein [Halteromyces radiatus]|uniref:VTC domain-containing protein n=1 Tax=Halteromyces radiatus TaxID=101107 RepID=UPI00221FE5E1|nr:VTC domain-containing protein [Halteromyces radiatus]KAI8100162.1 VTC domain-containing protein [Halteromyces radiatus]
MKYGLELQQNIFTPWRLSYVSYDVLKKELKSRQLDHGWTDQDEKAFDTLLENELTKVYDFINAKLTEIDARILYCERTIQTLQKNPNMASDTNYTIMDEALTEILFDVNDLSRFTRVNFTAIQKILKKHDKWTHLNLKQTYVSKLRDKPLDKQRFDVAIIYISALHDICRNHGHQSPGDNTAGADQNAFERATAKYWIHPDNITEVKAIIMLHLPVLIFNKEKKYEPADSAISSIYFDNNNFDLYTARLQRDEGAEAIRYRWYGNTDNKDIFIERKTHHASWLDGASVKDRFRLEESQVNAFTVGRRTADDIVNNLRKQDMDPSVIDNIHFIASGVQKSLRDKRLGPVIRVFYNRTAFQLPDNQRLRISLDTDLTFIREDHLDGQQRRVPDYNWRRNDIGIDFPFQQVKETDILRFPYAVLETKLQTHLGQQPPQWLTSLVESHLVHEVPRFSKYLHGACHFYRNRLPLLPWWLAELNVDIRKPRAENTGLTRSRSFKPLIDGRYRRAMIEEKERANQEAVVNDDKSDYSNTAKGTSNNSNINSDSSRPSSKNTLGTQQSSSESTARTSNSKPLPYRFSSDDPGVDFSPPKKDYTIVNVSPSVSPSSQQDYSHRQSISLLQNGNYPERPSFLDTGKVSAATKQFTDKVLQRIRNSDSIHFGRPSTNQEKPPRRSQQKYDHDGGRISIPKSHSLIGIPVDEDISGQGRRQKVKVRAEPKTFFANERTFISWLQFCALLLTVALNLLNFGDNTSRTIGGVFLGLSALVAIYALYRFEKRAWMINNRVDGRYDDLVGPAILCFLLVIALIVSPCECRTPI